jgi:TonB family protein
MYNSGWQRKSSTARATNKLGMKELRPAALVFRVFVFLVFASAMTFAQSGVHRPRVNSHDYGVNLTFSIFQFDEAHSPALEATTRLPESFTTPEEENAFLKVKEKLGEVALRHSRAVGLTSGQPFSDAVLLGPEYMLIKVTPEEVEPGHIKLSVAVKYANNALLDAKGLGFDSFETVLLRGGKGSFGVKYFIGAGGRRESTPIERTLLVSVTPEVVPVSSLRDRPGDLSHPVDQYGSPLTLSQDDKFTPPVVLSRVAPSFETGRKINGSVKLTCIIAADGKITNVQVVHSLDPDIDAKAIEAFRQYQFSAAVLNGKPAPASFDEELTFAREVTPWEVEEQQIEDKKKNKPPVKPRNSPFPWPPLL